MALWNLVRTNQAFFLSLIWLIVFTTVYLWPASWWFEVERVTVFDAHEDERVFMDVERTVHRPFYGEWTVLVRQVTPGGSEIVCTAHGGGEYITEAVLPDVLTLSWWTDGECPTLLPGYHYITTTWEVSGGLLPAKRITISSNVFYVAPASDHSPTAMLGTSTSD